MSTNNSPSRLIGRRKLSRILLPRPISGSIPRHGAMAGTMKATEAKAESIARSAARTVTHE
jgi:hypothetical protein